MSDASSWAAVGVSIVALGWTAWVDYRTRRESRKVAVEQKHAAVDGAISRVVAQWAVTRLRDITYNIDSNLDGIKKSAQRWRQGCAEPLAIIPQTSHAYELIRNTVTAVSEFEGVIDPIREGKLPVDATAIQDALTSMQNAVWGSIHQLTALKDSTS
jgi:hypothetical protein